MVAGLRNFCRIGDTIERSKPLSFGPFAGTRFTHVVANSVEAELGSDLIEHGDWIVKKCGNCGTTEHCSCGGRD